MRISQFESIRIKNIECVNVISEFDSHSIRNQFELNERVNETIIQKINLCKTIFWYKE